MKSMTDILITAFVPKSIRFEFQLASRHLLSGGGQTFLTISAVAAGVFVVIFSTSLMFGLQDTQAQLLTGTIAHITVRVEDPKPQTLDELRNASSNPVSSRIEVQAPQLKFIDDWEQVVKTIRQ